MTYCSVMDELSCVISACMSAQSLNPVVMKRMTHGPQETPHHSGCRKCVSRLKMNELLTLSQKMTKT